MPVTTDGDRVPWLLLVFSLPASRASQRVEIWRKLKKCGALPLRSSGYILPNKAANQERLEWLATAIRNYRGQASLAQVNAFDDLPDEKLRQLFIQARTRDYESLLRELKTFLALPVARRSTSGLSRLRKRFQEIIAIDFFSNPLRSRVETAFSRAAESERNGSGRQTRANSAEYRDRKWITRPRPGIDRVSSAWLIRHFIDPKAQFLFNDDPSSDSEAVPFDMFVPQGFGHRGDDCTFETLCKHFSIRDAKARLVAQIVHDADLNDEKFGRVEGQGLDQVLNGWAQLDISDEELLERGMSLIEGLYHSLP